MFILHEFDFFCYLQYCLNTPGTATEDDDDEYITVWKI
jgi:hypothetical protein